MPLATSPLAFAGKTFSSRLVLAPINTGFAKEGNPTTELLRFHRERSGLGIGLSVVGNVSVSMIGRSNQGTAVMRADRIKSFSEIAKTIRLRGSMAGIQLAQSPGRLSPGRRWRHRDPPAEVARLRRLVAQLSASEISGRLFDFISAARMSRYSGFDLVQVHAAHGYLISLLVSRYTNARRDEFASNGPWVEDFISHLRQAVGLALLSVRVSVRIGIDNAESEEAAAIQMCHRLAEDGVQVLDLTDGMYTLDRHLIYPAASRERFARMRGLAGHIARATGALVVFAAGVTAPEILLEPIPDNVLVAVGRPLIADPQFAKKLALGRLETIRHCSRSGHCHYFTRNRPHLECGSNPEAEEGG